MTENISQEVYIFEEPSEEEPSQSQPGEHSPTRLRPIRTVIRSARGKSSEPDSDSPNDTHQEAANTLKPQVFEVKDEYTTKQQPQEGNAEQLNHSPVLLPDCSPDMPPLCSPLYLHSDSPEDSAESPTNSGTNALPGEQKTFGLSSNFEETKSHHETSTPKRTEQQHKINRNRRMEPQDANETHPSTRRQMEPQAEREDDGDNEEEGYDEEEEDSMESVDESEYLDQFPIPSASVQRGEPSSFFQVMPVPSSSQVETHATISKSFLMQPLMQGTSLSCWVVVRKTGILKTGTTMLVYTRNEKKLLMAAKKLAAKTTSQYLISLSAENITTRDANYFACCRSNFFGTEWNIYDSGELPEKTDNPESVRKHLAFIEYEFNLFGLNGPRKMDVVIPRLTKANRASVVRSIEGDNGLRQYREDHPDKIMRLHNKAPTFDVKQKVFILDFKGKVKEASVKNFILHDNYTKRDCLIFGKHTEQRYLMEFSYPLSPVQAFGICLSSMDRKLMVE